MTENISSPGSAGQVSASKGKRFAAGVIDLILIPVVLGFLIGLMLVAVPDAVRSVVLVIVNVVWLVVRDTVFAPGRAMVGLQLVSLVGDRVSIGQALIRNILFIVPFVLVIGYIVEVIALISKGHRVGDIWAKTQVVDKD